ncbi:MAG: hypothetical protein QOC82_1906 [Frankiaceae bacterium]|nr:hypothetical protein [Frankiaceae bacterium]
MTTDRPEERPLRLLPAPASDPPYDDELGAAASAVDGALALAFPTTASAVPLRLAPPAIEEEFDERITPRASLPDPAPLARRFAQAVVEIAAGDRPISQLSRYATLDVLDQLERSVRRRAAQPVGVMRTAVGAAAGSASAAAAARPRVTSVHLSEPADGVAEGCAVITAGQRRRALAFRLEGLDGRWQCTALRIG